MSYREDLPALIGSAKIIRSAARHLLDGGIDSLPDEQRDFAEHIERAAMKLIDLVSEGFDSLDLLEVNNQAFAEAVQQLKAPLTSIIGYGNLIEGFYIGSMNELQNYQLMKIRRAARLVRARLDRWSPVVPLPVGPLRLARRFFDLDEILKKAMEELARALKGKKPIELQLTVEENLPNAFGDAHRTHQIISKLLDNAAKFTNAGKISITARTQHVREGHLRLQIAIADTGIGMSPDLCLAANNPRRMPAPTHGFGLVIAIGVTRGQGGNLWLESEEGVGTVAYVQLPTTDEKPRRDPLFNTPRRLYRSHRKGFVLDSS